MDSSRITASLIAAVACLVASAMSTGESHYPPYVKNKTLYATNDFRGKQAPKLVVAKWLKGKAPDTKGKVVLIDYWATWCPSCIETIPELVRFQKAHPKDLVVIGVTDEKESVVRQFMKKTPMPYDVALDPEDRMFKKIDIQGIPQVLVISPDGIVRWQGFPLDPADKLTDAKLDQIINTALRK